MRFLLVPFCPLREPRDYRLIYPQHRWWWTRGGDIQTFLFLALLPPSDLIYYPRPAQNCSTGSGSLPLKNRKWMPAPKEKEVDTSHVWRSPTNQLFFASLSLTHTLSKKRFCFFPFCFLELLLPRTPFLPDWRLLSSILRQ